MQTLTADNDPSATKHALPDLVADRRAERDSITDAGGTIARFEMAYSPPRSERVAFGPPLSARLPSYIYLAFAVAVFATVVLAHHSPSTSRLFLWVVSGDHNRPMSAMGLAIIVLVSGVATVARAHMRGVVVLPDGIETRDLFPLGIPKVNRWAWAQCHRFVVSGDDVAIELWDSRYERLPKVADGARLAALLTEIAAERRILVTTLGR